ncbi:hypothetical protein ACFYXM_33985 [Streptomyces sp. NPDC002476]|uniref:hypothetical protein n=1 Tax=Streptomyces sp. NPDC002476 TaxID=3364648 RepID=UPI00369C6CC8
MANTRGGLLIYGVTNDRKIEGVDWGKADLRQYAQGMTAGTGVDRPASGVQPVHAGDDRGRVPLVRRLVLAGSARTAVPGARPDRRSSAALL